MQGPYTKYQGHGLPEEDEVGPVILLYSDDILTADEIAETAFKEIVARLTIGGSPAFKSLPNQQ